MISPACERKASSSHSSWTSIPDHPPRPSVVYRHDSRALRVRLTQGHAASLRVAAKLFAMRRLMNVHPACKWTRPRSSPGCRGARSATSWRTARRHDDGRHAQAHALIVGNLFELLQARLDRRRWAVLMRIRRRCRPRDDPISRRRGRARRGKRARPDCEGARAALRRFCRHRPTTIDLGDKAAEYLRLPSLVAYLVSRAGRGQGLGLDRGSDQRSRHRRVRRRMSVDATRSAITRARYRSSALRTSTPTSNSTERPRANRRAADR